MSLQYWDAVGLPNKIHASADGLVYLCGMPVWHGNDRHDQDLQARFRRDLGVCLSCGRAARRMEAAK